MSLAESLIAELDDQALDRLAALLAPRLAAVPPGTADGPLTTSLAAKRAGVHERTIRRALAAGTLPGTTVAGRWRIEPDDLDEWIARGAPTSSAAAIGNARGSKASGGTRGALAIRGAER